MADEKTQKPGLGRRKSSLDTLRHLSQRFKHVGRKTSESVEEEREIIGGKLSGHVPFGAALATACSFKMQGPFFVVCPSLPQRSSLILHTQMFDFPCSLT
jgi:hypoxanthine-guanine phosphoribosyltransferase